MNEDKYIKLLLERCLKLEENQPLFINYNIVNQDFVDKLIDYANSLGVNDIYLDKVDMQGYHDTLMNIDIMEIKNHEMFNCQIWDEYVKKNAAFLMLSTEIPNLMDDVSSKKIAEADKVKLKSKPLYKEKQLKNEIAWCIACLPNEKWAEVVFKDSKQPLKDFEECLNKMTMLDKMDPIAAWDELLNEQKNLIDKLNALEIESLHFTNDLGTDLTVYLDKSAIFSCACSGKWIVNMPSYEVFTTPDYRKTEGIVYSSKPLMYNGKLIDEFNLTFKNGQVTKIAAKKGQDVLEEIINTDELSAYLGEVALVNYDSPISNTNRVFMSTLFDENASCHVALGSGFLECILNGENLSKDELKEIGLNSSSNHVDFMIGTKDLLVTAQTINGEVTIMENGNLVI